MELFYLTDSKEDQKEITEFIKRNSSEGGAEFLQSYEWGKFIENGGEEIIRVGVREEKNILLITTLVKKIIFKPFFYWYAPRGPIGDLKVIDFLWQEIKKINSGAIFLRFEPLKINLNELNRIHNNFVFKKTLDLQPAKTLILDLDKKEEDILNSMHQKTRYNIRLAQKKGVIIKEGSANPDESAADLKEFWRLLQATGERDNFRLHPFSHYEKLLKINSTTPGFIKLFLASYEGKNIAGGIFSFYGDKATYLHGASDNQYRNLMAPYLLQFSLMQKAQKEGYRYYDFYGIDEKKWPGVTRFKLGYGGRVFEYLGTSDFILRPFFYRFYELARKIRRLI